MSAPTEGQRQRHHKATHKTLREIRDFELIAEVLGVDKETAHVRLREIEKERPRLTNAELSVLTLAEFAKTRAAE
jgi:hypothetical protein